MVPSIFCLLQHNDFIYIQRCGNESEAEGDTSLLTRHGSYHPSVNKATGHPR